MEIEMRVSEDLSRGDQRDFFVNFLHRTTPGIRFIFMRDHALRRDVEFKRSPRKLTATI